MIKDYTGKIELPRGGTEDLVLEIHHVLTEPTYPTAFLKWKISGQILARFNRSTMEELIVCVEEFIDEELIEKSKR